MKLCPQSWIQVIGGGGLWVVQQIHTRLSTGTDIGVDCRIAFPALKDHLNEPVDAMTIKLSPEGVTKQVRMIMGTDKRTTITNNWSVFVKAAGIKEFDICVFTFEIENGRPTLTIRRI